jgi:two-component system sensor histidine kinase UhpB
MSTWEWNIRTGEVDRARELETKHGVAPGSFGGTFESFLDIVHPNDRDRVRETVVEAAEKGQRFELEYRIVLPDGQIRWRMTAGDIVADQAGQANRMIGVGRDITQQREAEERLRLAEGRYRTLVEQLPLASYVEQLDAESAMYMSPQIADLVGYSAEEWVADPSFFARVLHPEDRDRVLAGFASMHETGEQSDSDYRLIARDGRMVWVHDAAVVVHDAAGIPLYSQGYMIDISERKRSEEALQKSQEELRQAVESLEHLQLERARLLDYTVNAAEEERIGIAAELHDGPIQKLSALAFTLDLAGLHLNRSNFESARDAIDAVRTQLSGQMDSLRRLMSELRPPVLDEGGIEAALGDYTAEFARHERLECLFTAELDGARLAPGIETTLYRVTQEALSNVAKHAQATKVRVTLNLDATAVRLQIEDNGVGFDRDRTAQFVRDGHYGLIGTRERAERAGGTWEVSSAPGRGTSIEIVIPVDVATSAPPITRPTVAA